MAKIRRYYASSSEVLLMSYEYLKERRSIEDSNNVTTIEEFYCSTCKLEVDPNTTQKVVERTPKQCSIYIPSEIRKVYPIGIIFTKNSLIAPSHFTSDCKHVWGKYNRD